MKKSPLDELILWTLSLLNKWHIGRIEKYGKYLIDNPDNYEVLLPNTTLDEKSHYDNPLFVALKTPKAINIAVTGPYGSGKSSFLRTFELKNAEWKYLPISLATFKDKDKEKENNKNTEDSPKAKVPSSGDDSSDINKPNEKSLFEQHQDIERSILQQFFYRETDSKVPFSRFKRIKNIHKKIIFYHSFIIGFLSIYIFNLYKPEVISKIFSLNPFELDKYHIISYITSLVLFYYLYKIFEYLWKIQISKFNFKKGEITLAKQDKASILNEHLDEILYFFEVTNYNVVVFEDLDRFNNTEIFIKLRELNNLINNSKQIGREVKFIYAIKDDMFIDKERTKFFDFIVPIIPYINPSNSERKLADKFSKEIEDKRISESFISQVSLYIEDMRLLLNIYNEYMIYKNNLDIKNSTFVYNKILALVIYKNFYPLEFTKLHSRKGLIFDLFSSKSKYIKESIDRYKDEKNTFEEKINQINNEKISNLEELRLIYLAKIFSSINAQYISIQGNYQTKKTIAQLNTENAFDNIIESATLCIGFHQHNSELGRISFEDIEKSISKYTYKQRKEFIKASSTDELNKLKTSIEEIDKKIDELKHATLKELFKISSELIITDKYKEQDLLIFLVRNGYIDENYEHYISYFHKGGITQEDREFLLSVQNFKRLDFQFKLGNVKKLIEKLEDNNFHQIEILNIDLLKYLLKNKTKQQYSIQLQTYIKQLSNASELSKKFIFEFLDIAESNYQLTLIENLKLNELWQYIYTTFSSEKQKEYFKLIFEALEIEKIVALNIDNTLENYIENQTKLPRLNKEKTEKCEQLISKLNIKFSNIENPSENSSFFDFIYQNNHYILNRDMINIIMKLKGNIGFDDLKTSHLTTIQGSEAEFLKTYIDEDINEYVKNIFLEIEENTQETEQTVIDLLNNENITFTNKVAIIEKEDVKISDITSIKDTNLWNELLQQNKVMVTWDNLLYFYQDDEELNKTILDFLNIEENYTELSKSKINNEELFDKDTILSDFNRKILLSTQIRDESYKYLIKSIWFWKYEKLDIKNLNNMQVNCILQESKLALSKENIDNLKEKFSPKHITLIENFKDDFLEQVNDFELDIDDIILLINSEKFTIGEKFIIIENISTALFENNKEAKETISKLYIENNRKLELELFEKLFYGENDYALELIVSQIPYFENCTICRSYLNEFDEPYSELLQDGQGSVTLDNTKLNKLLATKLNEKQCIGKFPITKNKIRAYKRDFN